MKHYYWNEVYPKMGESHMRLAMEVECLYATQYPFVDYGIDIGQMGDIDRGVQLKTMTRTDVDANPSKYSKEKLKKLEYRIAETKSRKSDFIPEKFHGKGPHGYMLKEWIKHKGPGGYHVNRTFDRCFRFYKDPKRHHKLSANMVERMQGGGPRIAGNAHYK